MVRLSGREDLDGNGKTEIKELTGRSRIVSISIGQTMRA